MKHFITILSTIILMAVASYTARAQYAYQIPQTTEQGQVVQQPFNLTQLPEYQEAKQKENKGRTLFFVGLGTQVVGAGLMLVPVARTDTYYNYGSTTTHTEVSGLGMSCFFIGCASVIAGSTMEIIGLCKWMNGVATIRDLRIAYAVTGNGIVVTF